MSFLLHHHKDSSNDDFGEYLDHVIDFESFTTVSHDHGKRFTSQMKRSLFVVLFTKVKREPIVDLLVVTRPSDTFFYESLNAYVV